MPSTSKINDSFTLKNGRVIKNRLMKSAMSEQLGLPDHNPGKGLERVYRAWAEGGVGLCVSGNIMVDRQHLGEPKNVVLDEQSDLAAFRRWTAAGTTADASGQATEFWAQLNHPGKQIPAFLNKAPVSPSAVALGAGLDKAFATPRALTDSEVEQTIGRYVKAAQLAKEVGFTGVQIHGAHGYLVSQFLSPRSNVRTDRWGGSLENRMRFVREIYAGMRRAVGEDFPLAIKLNSADFMKGGFTEEDSMQVVKALSEDGIDLIEISGGTYEAPEMAKETQKDSTRKREAFFLDYARKVRSETKAALAVTGGFRSTRGMNDALADGALDIVGVARPLCIAPDLPKQALNDEKYNIELPHLSVGIKAIDRIAAHNIYWYENQLWLMAKGRKPRPTLSPWLSFGATMLNNGKYALKKRRA